MHFAQVIVDVPTMQTDRTYDYQVPNNLKVAIGMRVIVNFGKGERAVQGFVVGMNDDVKFNGPIKPILAVLDKKPVLNTELLALSTWLARTTFAFRITSMQTMLPSALRANYQKFFKPTTIAGMKTLSLFNEQPTILWDKNSDQHLIKQLLKARRNGEVTLNYRVTDQLTPKQALAVYRCLDNDQLKQAQQQLRKNAKKQRELITLLLTLPMHRNFLLTDLINKSAISANVWHQAIAKKWLATTMVEVYRQPYPQLSRRIVNHIPQLTPQQQLAVDAINDSNGYQPFLLEGVTGSGKTEVYLQVIAHALSKGKTALMLVPEISLTLQTVRRIIARFGSQVAVLHSRLSVGEKYDEWRRIINGEAKVVVGARSAIFAPLQNIGVIILDEEHETSYKQEETPRYHARDVALWRGRYHHCPVILGSATPSLESRARAQKNVYHLLMLDERINHQPLPQVELVDMRHEITKQTVNNYSPMLISALKQCIEHHEQSVLLLNRRGYSSSVICRDCGYVFKCPNCDISLTLHMHQHVLCCHYCGYQMPIPQICPQCHSQRLRFYGTGTEKAEQELSHLLPQARILRMDVDTTKHKGAHDRILQQFGNHQADILLGTQMIAKGLDFPNVTLVGVLNADTSLSLPDFRASERTFDLLTQVSGRAGRADKSGRVIIQTYNPQHYAIQYARHHNYEGFFYHEMKIRHRGHYSPYYFMIKIVVSHIDENKAAQKIFEIMQILQPVLSSQAILLGPTRSAIARINRRYYYQMVIKYKQEPQLMTTLTTILNTTQIDIKKGYQIIIDREPIDFI